MSDSQSPRSRAVVLVAIFAWATGLLTGALLWAAYGLIRTPRDSQVGFFVPMKPQPSLATRGPLPLPKPDCPAHKYWTSCDPVARAPADLDKALTTPPEQLGWIDVSAKGWGNGKIDGVQYGFSQPWTKQPIVPGPHVIDLFDYRGMRHARCEVDITPGRRVLALFGTSGNCVVIEVTDQVRVP